MTTDAKDDAARSLVRTQAREMCGTWGVETIDTLLDHIATLTRERDGLLVINGDLARDNDLLIAERDEARRDAERWREFTQGINRVHDSGFDECVIRYDTSELAHLAVTDIRNVLDAARTADAGISPTPESA
jgi:hypothetical protein